MALILVKLDTITPLFSFSFTL